MDRPMTMPRQLKRLFRYAGSIFRVKVKPSVKAPVQRRDAPTKYVRTSETKVHSAPNFPAPDGPIVVRLRRKIRFRAVRYRHTLKGSPLDPIRDCRRPFIQPRDLLEAATCDDLKYYYEWGPRKRSHDCIQEASLARFTRRQRRLHFHLRHQRAVNRQLADTYHSGYGLPPFSLPPPVPTLPLAPCRGDHIITIVTTACLPWLTGTSINPLLRAAYLERYYGMRVTILFPWISVEEQVCVYNGTVFQSREAQGEYVLDWLNRRLGIESRVRVRFYDAWHDPRKGSILPVDRSDVTEHILDSDADVAVLEEPEHLTWYHMMGKKWRSKFGLSVGVAHTNYVEYIRRDRGDFTAVFVSFWNWLMVRANCHRVIRLSAAVQFFDHSAVCAVHGVSPQFLEEQSVDSCGQPTFPRGAYFIGKVLWGKGYRELLDLLLTHCQTHGFPHKAKATSDREVVWVDVFGSGSDEEEVMAFASTHHLPLRFFGKTDHAAKPLREYKVFVNPSTSDVLCTTTAEALAMGKIAVVADHPSNEFFRDNFPQNCLTYDYRKPEAFSAALFRASSMEPRPLHPHQRRLLTWEAVRGVRAVGGCCLLLVEDRSGKKCVEGIVVGGGF